jgi:hypothetical protein
MNAFQETQIPAAEVEVDISCSFVVLANKVSWELLNGVRRLTAFGLYKIRNLMVERTLCLAHSDKLSKKISDCWSFMELF